MKKIWYFYSDDELLTTEEQKIQERQQNMSIGFWIGFTTMVILFNTLIFLFN
jgi:hypothetical protein